MKRTFFLILITALLISSSISAQIVIHTGSKAEINKFLKSTTYVVLKNEFLSDYNDAIKEVVRDHWTITPFEFINESDFKTQRKDASKSFLVINQAYFTKDKTGTLFDFLILTTGGNYKTVNDMPTLCGIPLSYHNAPETDYVYKLGIMVKFIQNHIEITKNNPNLNQDNIADYYTKKSGKPDNKTLFILKNDIEPELRTKSAFEKYYQYDFEYSTEDKIVGLIKSNDKNAIILHRISPQSNSELNYCVKIIIDTENALIYYYDMNKINKNNPPYFLTSDLKKLSNKK